MSWHHGRKKGETERRWVLDQASPEGFLWFFSYVSQWITVVAQPTVSHISSFFFCIQMLPTWYCVHLVYYNIPGTYYNLALKRSSVNIWWNNKQTNKWIKPKPSGRKTRGTTLHIRPFEEASCRVSAGLIDPVYFKRSLQVPLFPD